MIQLRTKSAEETRSLAAALATAAHPRDLILLSGDLGSGKTTFSQGFGAGLGVKESVTSPTFVLIRTYAADIPMHHADVYRVERLQEVIDLGLMEMLDEGGVALVEWGDIASPVLPRDFLEVRLRVDTEDEEARLIRLQPVGSSWSNRERFVREAAAAWVTDATGEGRQ